MVVRYTGIQLFFEMATAICENKNQHWTIPAVQIKQRKKPFCETVPLRNLPILYLLRSAASTSPVC